MLICPPTYTAALLLIPSVTSARGHCRFPHAGDRLEKKPQARLVAVLGALLLLCGLAMMLPPFFSTSMIGLDSSAFCCRAVPD